MDVNEEVAPSDPEQVGDRIVDRESSGTTLTTPDTIRESVSGLFCFWLVCLGHLLTETDRGGQNREVVVEPPKVTLDRSEPTIQVVPTGSTHRGTRIGIENCRLHVGHRPSRTFVQLSRDRAISTRASTLAITVEHPRSAHLMSVLREPDRIGRESRESKGHPAEMMSKVDRTYHATSPSWYDSRGRSVSRITPRAATPSRNSRPAWSTSYRIW